jgi:hypothetical protein
VDLQDLPMVNPEAPITDHPHQEDHTGPLALVVTAEAYFLSKPCYS